MVEPAGAMAMFVLRLAGLLSLENALQDPEANFTDPYFNFTNLSLNQSAPLMNLTWPGMDQYNLNLLKNISNKHPSIPSTQESTSPTLRSSAPITVVSTTSTSLPTSFHSTNRSTQTPKRRLRPHKTPVPPVNGHYNKHSQKYGRRRNLSPSGRRRKLARSEALNGRSDSARSSRRIHVQISGSGGLASLADSFEQQIPKPISQDQRKRGNETFTRVTAGMELHKSGEDTKDTADSFHSSISSSHHGSQIKTGRFDYTSELYPESFSVITPLPVTATAYSQPETAHFTSAAAPSKQVSPSAVSMEAASPSPDPIEAAPPSPYPIEDISSTSTSTEEVTPTLLPRDEVPTSTFLAAELPTLPSPLSTVEIPGPRMEMLAEDDGQLMGLVDHEKLRNLEVPPEDFIRSDFEYYDYGVHHHEALPTEAPTLSSLNLVSAVPISRHPGHPLPSQPTQQNPREDLYSKPKKLPPARPIPPSYPRRGISNNPYPYGPKLLPGPYAPLTPNLPPSATEDEARDRHVTTDYSYEEDFDYYYDSHDPGDSGYEVQTKEPPVLFVFDKPGYSPEAPTTLLPATRSPTPSDPWDCAPKCPRYTLLDWNTDYDVRQYPRTSWVSTVIISENRVLAELEGYMRVQDYFYGLNDQGMVLNLTIPFVTQIKFGKHPGVLHETNDYTVSLYVQPGYTLKAADLPTPISNEVLVDELEPKTIFVHSFEANVWDVTERFLEEKVETLMNQLRHNGEAFLDRYYYLASYSRPELYQPVYYEVWVYATNFRDPQISAAPSGGRRLPQTNKVTQKTLNKLCRGVECPTFEVLRTYKYGIQKRRYFNGLFASTSPKECQFTTMSVWKGFMPLHLYKHGINSHMEVIEATRPIALVNVRDSSDPNTECPQNMTMSLYLPKRLHSNPPITGFAAPEVHITTMNDVIVYAYTIGGYLLDPMRVRKELADMKYRLTEFGACYKDDEYYVVIYDFIVRYHGRQNEIWIVAENCKATHNG